GRGGLSTGLRAASERVSRGRWMARLPEGGVPLAAPSARELADEARAVRRWLDRPAGPPVVTVPTLVLLARLRRLALLRELFGRVVVPRDDHVEVLTWGSPLPDGAVFQAASWIQVHRPAEAARARRRRWCTDTESRALGAASGEDGSPGLLLAEEAAVRHAASEAGVIAACLASVLLAADEAGMVADARVLLDALPAQGYRLPALG